ncbi:hypothetical protein KEM54_005424 [Ascosphaera aggregata]|nr:hypothetical protein KEM54_005424 [Ascosphaera aggregata]
MAHLQRAKDLLRVLEITKASVETIVSQWEESPPDAPPQPGEDKSPGSDALPSKELYEAKRRLIAATGKFVEIVSDPGDRILDITSQYHEARCLHIAASVRIPEILAKGADDGLSINEISAEAGIERRKLARILRCLCSSGVFREVEDGIFANNRISSALVNNEPLRAGGLLFTCSDQLPRTLLDEKTGPSYSTRDAAYTKASGNSDIWAWFEEKQTIESLITGSSVPYPGPYGTEVSDLIKANKSDMQKKVPRPELELMHLAMVGGGRISCRAQPFDFPWSSLGKATVVDVGGGVGGFCLQLSKLYPDLSFIIQDRAAIISKAKDEVWLREHPSAMEEGRVDFQVHDFFLENPVKGADIYWIRYVLHDWPDDEAIRILSAVRKSMSLKSKLILCEQVMNTTAGCPDIPSAPEPLPANYGTFIKYSHCRDVAMMCLHNGIERTPAELRELVQKSGLIMRTIYPCRSQVSLVECVLPEAADNV